MDVLFAEAGDRVESALFPVAAFTLEIPDVQLIPKPFHDLLRKQVIDQSSLDASIVVHQLKHTLSPGLEKSYSLFEYIANRSKIYRQC